MADWVAGWAVVGTDLGVAAAARVEEVMAAAAKEVVGMAASEETDRRCPGWCR